MDIVMMMPNKTVIIIIITTTTVVRTWEVTKVVMVSETLAGQAHVNDVQKECVSDHFIYRPFNYHEVYQNSLFFSIHNTV